MNTITTNAAGPGALFVRALYDYEADDHTSLSFKQGAVIQVITQLESGWWDGVIGGVRGWFPSNYCAVISTPGESRSQDVDTEDESEGEYMDSGVATARSEKPQEEAAFWIPQATPDGRLFYFNTLTGVSTMELPLESPTSPNESGPRDRTNIYIPDQTRPPPEMLAGGFERNDDTDYESASEAGVRRRSYNSQSITSPASMDSLNGLPFRSRNTTDATTISFSAVSQVHPVNGTSNTSFAGNVPGPAPAGKIPHSLFPTTPSVVFTWDTLLDNVRRSIFRFKEAIKDDHRMDFVKRAEDVSDHLRLLIAAATGTTDMNPGNASAVVANKALYPHYREMMARFSKLVLSAHFAAADFRTADALAKSTHEADGLLNGAEGYVEVARTQRGEELPRLAPGFILASRVGGSWRNHRLTTFDTSQLLPSDPDTDTYAEPHVPLDVTLLDRIEALRKTIATNIRQLDQQLMLRDKLVTPKLHKTLSENVCVEVGRVMQSFKPFISTTESIDLSAFRADAQNPQLEEFSMQKQKSYDLSADLILAAQAVGAPVGDEWSDARGSSLEERLGAVRTQARDLDRALTQTQFSIQLLAEIIPVNTAGGHKLAQRRTDGALNGDHLKLDRPPMLGDVGSTRSYQAGANPMAGVHQVNTKVNRFFGEVNAPVSSAAAPPADPNVAPDAGAVSFLGLDHENEIQYDTKTTPPQLRGGTLTGLVEQLTRHDKLDSLYNNTFLLTYQSFTNANELFEMLVKRWCIQPPPGLAGKNLQLWTEKKQKPIRFRVVNILKSWFDNYWMEGNDETAQKLMIRVYTFAKETVMSTSTPGAAPLMTVIQQRMHGQDAATRRMVQTSNMAPPAPIMPRNLKKLKLMDIDPVEFARQLTLIESRLYCKIKATECLNKTWQKKVVDGEPEAAPHVKAFILHSNQLTNWVAHMILTQSDSKRRHVVIKHFVTIAERCWQLNNFSTLTSIVSALGTAPIHRLSRTWAQVNQKTMATLENMRKLINSTKNFVEYRDALHKADPPCIPFVGVYLTDLTFIEDGIPSIIKQTDLINFAKRAKTAEVINNIQQYQNLPYILQPVPELQEYMLGNMGLADDVHNMYERSLQAEPREREDEKIARLLSESGFL